MRTRALWRRWFVLTFRRYCSAELAGQRGKHIYATNSMVLSVALRMTLAPRWLMPLLHNLSECVRARARIAHSSPCAALTADGAARRSYRRQALWCSVSTEGTESRSALARYNMSSALQHGLDGNLREAALALAQSANLHLACGFLGLWRLNAMLLAGLYCGSGEMLDGGSPLARLASVNVGADARSPCPFWQRPTDCSRSSTSSR